MIDDEIVETANRRGAKTKAAFLAVVAARYDRRIGRIVISLANGLDLAFAPHLAEGFAHARPADLDLPGLLEGLLGSKRWMAAENGRAGGKAATPAKRLASRENGKLGGRPKKTAGAEGNS